MSIDQCKTPARWEWAGFFEICGNVAVSAMPSPTAHRRNCDHPRCQTFTRARRLTGMSPEWLTDTPPAAATAKRKLGRAFTMSIAAHAGFAFLLLIFMSVHEAPVDTKAPPVKLNVFYMPTPGPVGGGGGNPAPASAKTTEVPHHELPKPVTITPATVTPEPPR